MAFLEERQRQFEQVCKDVRMPLHVQGGLEVHDDPCAERGDALLAQHEGAEAECEQVQQIAAARHESVIDDPLKEQRARDDEPFQHGAEAQHLSERRRRAVDTADEVVKPYSWPRLVELEMWGWPKLERNPRECGVGGFDRQRA